MATSENKMDPRDKYYRTHHTVRESSNINYSLKSPFFTTPPHLNDSPNNNFNALRAKSHLNSLNLNGETLNNVDLKYMRKPSHNRSSSFTYQYLDQNSPMNYQGLNTEQLKEVDKEDLDNLNYFRDIDSEEEEKKNNLLGLQNLNKKLPFTTTKDSPVNKYNKIIKENQNTINNLSNQLSKAQFLVTELNQKLHDMEEKFKDTNDKLKNVTIRCIQAEKRENQIKEKNLELEEEIKELKLSINSDNNSSKQDIDINNKLKCINQNKLDSILAIDKVINESKQSLQTLINQFNNLNLLKNQLNTMDTIISIKEDNEK